MTVKYIREDRVPEGAIRPRYRTTYNGLWDDYEKIIHKYTDPAYTGTFVSVGVTDETGTYSLQTTTVYFKSVEAIDAFKAEATTYLESHINKKLDADHFHDKQGITRRYQVRSMDTDEVLRNWTDMKVDKL